MRKVEKIHQRVRAALLRGRAVSKKDRLRAFEAMSIIDAQLESSLLMLESQCKGLDAELGDLVGHLLTQHLILSDLTFWLKAQIPQGGKND